MDDHGASITTNPVKTHSKPKPASKKLQAAKKEKSVELGSKKELIKPSRSCTTKYRKRISVKSLEGCVPQKKSKKELDLEARNQARAASNWSRFSGFLVYYNRKS
jgi:hypothetical protein